MAHYNPVELKTRKLPSGNTVWMLHYYEAGKRCRVSIGVKEYAKNKKQAAMTRRQAETIRAAKELELQGIANDATRNKTSFSEYALFDYMPLAETELTADTAENYKFIIENRLIPYFGTKDLSLITNRDVRAYRAMQKQDKRLTKSFIDDNGKRIYYKQEPSNATINKDIKILKAIINSAFNGDVISSKKINTKLKPLSTVTTSIKYFTPEQMQEIYLKAKFPNYWRLMANTGVRINEALRLKWDDVKNDQILVESTNIQPTKSKKFRYVPLFDGAKQALDELVKLDVPDGYILPRRSGNALSDLAAYDLVNRVGLQDAHGHMLRHTFGTTCAAAGINVVLISNMMGHSSLAITQQYLHAVNANNLTKGISLNI